MGNSFISFDNQTGLAVKTKAEIFQDLLNLTKISYGSEFVVVPGTEMYAFLDNMAYSLAEMGSATKSVYDSFGFLSASGTTLDVLCSLSGISRREGETDTQLRNRHYKFLYSAATATSAALETKLLGLSYTHTDNYNLTKVYDLITDVRILNNAAATSHTEQGVSTPAHGITVIIALNNDLFSDNTILDATKLSLIQQINDTIENYKTLGCAVYTQNLSSDSSVPAYLRTQLRFLRTQALEVSIEVKVTYQKELFEHEEQGIQNAIKQNIANYINNLEIGNDIFYSGIMACVYNMYRQLGYTEDLLDIGEVKCTIQGGATIVMSPSVSVSVNANQKPVLKDSSVTETES